MYLVGLDVIRPEERYFFHENETDKNDPIIPKKDVHECVPSRAHILQWRKGGGDNTVHP